METFLRLKVEPVKAIPSHPSSPLRALDWAIKSLIIQITDTEQYFPVVLIIVVCEVFFLIDGRPSCDRLTCYHSNKSLLYKVIQTFIYICDEVLESAK